MEQLCSWRKSEALRSFVAAARTAAVTKYGDSEAEARLGDRMKWALRIADRLDLLSELKKARDDDPADAA